MKKLVFALLLAVLLVLGVLPSAALAYDSGGVTYNDHDIAAITTFLNAESATPGQTNAQILGYTVSDPTTWTGVTWTTVGSEQRVKTIGWYRAGIAGALDLSGCTGLTQLLCYTNALTALDVSGIASLTYLDCYDNSLATLKAEGCTALQTLFCMDNQLTTLDVRASTSLGTFNLVSNPWTQIKANIGGQAITIAANGNGTVNLSGITGSLAASASATAPSTFVNWTESGSQVSTISMYSIPAGDHTLMANFASCITYDGNGAESGSVPADATGYIPGATVTLPGNDGSLGKEGCDFNGWNTKEDYSGTHYDAGAAYTMPEGPVTLYVQWEPQDYSIAYNPNASSFTGSVPADSNAYHMGDTVTVLGNTGNLERSGYTFTGWNTAADGKGTHYNAGQTFTMPVGDRTLYADWKQNFTVKYNANSATGGTAPAAATYYEGQTAAVSGNTGSLVRSGYTFSGWNTSSGGTGTHYNPGDSLTISSNITLYAEWKYNNIISYNSNGSTSGTAPANAAFCAGQTATVSGNTGGLVRSGYTFSGWNTSNNGTGTHYDAGSTFTMPERNITLFAEWKINYNAYDTGKIQAFLALGSNARVLGYNINAPATWTGVTWAQSGNEWYVKKIEWMGKSLAGTLDLSGCPVLQSVDVHTNKLDGLVVNGCGALKQICCYENSISSINVAWFSGLTYLDVGQNKLTSLSLPGLTSLAELYCDNNSLGSLDVSGCPNLKSFGCALCSLTSLNMSGCSQLAVFDCYENSLTSLNIGSTLSYLDSRKNPMTQINVNLLNAYHVSNAMSITAAGPGYVGMAYDHPYMPTIYSTPIPGAQFTGWTGTEASSSAEFDLKKSGTYTANFTYNGGAALSGVNLSAGSLNRAFSAAVCKYTITIPGDQPTVTISPVKSFGGLSMTINKQPVSSYTVSLDSGKSTKVTVVVSYGKAKKTYTFTVKRLKSSNNLLASLAATAGTWSQGFDPNVLNYTLTLDENTKSTAIKAAAAAGTGAKVSPASAKVTLNNGQSKTVKITVKALSGAKRTYVITVVRAKSANADLKLLKAPGLSPGFNPAQTSYSITLPANKNSIAISAKAAGYKAAVSIDGGKASKKVTLANGQTVTVRVVVTSQAGSKKEYVITVTRQ